MSSPTDYLSWIRLSSRISYVWWLYLNFTAHCDSWCYLWWCAKYGFHTSQIWSRSTKELSSWWLLSLSCAFVNSSEGSWLEIVVLYWERKFIFWTLDLAGCSVAKYWTSNCSQSCVINVNLFIYIFYLMFNEHTDILLVFTATWVFKHDNKDRVYYHGLSHVKICWKENHDRSFYLPFQLLNHEWLTAVIVVFVTSPFPVPWICLDNFF